MPREASWSGTPAVRGSTETMRMFLLTFCMVGLSFTWGIELTYGTPYLLDLGLSKSHTSAVWVAGPLSGIIMQPLVGVFADNSKSKLGRRRPYMVAGSVVVAGALIVLGWTREFVGIFVRDSQSLRFWTLVAAIVTIYVIDFAVNVVMAASRSIIVDTLPISKQQIGSAWANRMGAVGHLIGYAIGALQLREIWGDWLGNTQLKQLCVIAALALLAACAVTSWAVTERVLIASKEEDRAANAWHLVANIFRTLTQLPNRIQAICWAQFWAWIAWFPFMFYGATWVGETYFRYENPAALRQSSDKLGDIGRTGSQSMVIFSLVTSASSIIIPFLVTSPDQAKRPFTPRPPPALATVLGLLYRNKPDLLTVWLCSHFLFATALFVTPFARSLALATAVVAVSGIPWSIAQWAPFAFMGAEVNRLAVNGGAHSERSNGGPVGSSGGRYHRVGTRDDSRPSSPVALHLHHEGLFDPMDDDLESEDPTGEMAGIYLGILNFFTSSPQLVGLVISMIVFAIVEPGQSRELGESQSNGMEGQTGTSSPGGHVPRQESIDEPGTRPEAATGVNAIAVCLFIGGLSSLGAAYATSRLRRVR